MSNDKMKKIFDTSAAGIVNIDTALVMASLPKVGKTLTGKELIVTEGGNIRTRFKQEDINFDNLLTKEGFSTGGAFIFWIKTVGT